MTGTCISVSLRHKKQRKGSMSFKLNWSWNHPGRDFTLSVTHSKKTAELGLIKMQDFGANDTNQKVKQQPWNGGKYCRSCTW